jgi:autotransporter-associated beta strand protein
MNPLTQSKNTTILPVLIALTLLLSSASSSFAGSATWLATPATGDWDTAGNWTAGGPPNGPSDTATFAVSNITDVSFSRYTEVNGIVFDAGASAFTITANPLDNTGNPPLTISGVGITNNSGIRQNFVAASDQARNAAAIILFTNSATAGSLTTFTNNGSTVLAPGGATYFFSTSSAGGATINNNGTSYIHGSGGYTVFVGDQSGSATAANATINNNGGRTPFVGVGSTQFTFSTAGNATINNNGGTFGGAAGGYLIITNQSSGGSATINNNGATTSGATGGITIFDTNSDAGSATLIANGGQGGEGGSIYFFGATGGTARVEVFGNGKLDISSNGGGVTTGSIEGGGRVFLGAFNLTVGSNNLSTTFFGKIQDGGFGGGSGGSLTKSGSGKLTLSKASTYTGGTTVSRGALRVTNGTGSATGTGTVQVNAGTLGGTGIITGAVTVGTGSSSGAIILPGNSATAPGILTINSALTFNSLSTYKCVLNRSTLIAGEITALGVTINSGASFTFVDVGTGTLTVGTVFTVINNTSADPIFGTFGNLADGSVITSNGNNFQASYTGGDGNDLTLTVVP